MQDPEFKTTPQPPPGWRYSSNGRATLDKDYAFAHWREALIFVELVLYLGELAGLQPGIVICGSRVAIKLGADEVQFARLLDAP